MYEQRAKPMLRLKWRKCSRVLDVNAERREIPEAVARIGKVISGWRIISEEPSRIKYSKPPVNRQQRLPPGGLGGHIHGAIMEAPRNPEDALIWSQKRFIKFHDFVISDLIFLIFAIVHSFESSQRVRNQFCTYLNAVRFSTYLHLHVHLRISVTPHIRHSRGGRHRSIWSQPCHHTNHSRHVRAHSEALTQNLNACYW